MESISITVGSPVTIIEQISGDDVPAGTAGTVAHMDVDGTVCVILAGQWATSNQYWTDISNLAPVV